MRGQKDLTGEKSVVGKWREKTCCPSNKFNWQICWDSALVPDENLANCLIVMKKAQLVIKSDNCWRVGIVGASLSSDPI